MFYTVTLDGWNRLEQESSYCEALLKGGDFLYDNGEIDCANLGPPCIKLHLQIDQVIFSKVIYL